jgi:RHS repeat-associated protein
VSAVKKNDSRPLFVPYTYDGDNNVLTITADMPGSTPDQVTQYVYNVSDAATIASGLSLTFSPTIQSNDMLWLVKYPDKTLGTAGTASSYINLFNYDGVGETLSKLDQNGTVHTYGYDVLGRVTSDAVTTLGSGVDGGIRRLETSYNTQGQIDKITSYSSATGGTGAIVSQIARVYNGFGQLTEEYQEHSGAVNTSTSLNVQYGYSDAAHGSRQTSMTYPSGKVLYYNYGTTGSLNDVISRLDNIAETGQTLETYSYLGLSTVVQRYQNQTGIELTYIKQSGELDGEAGDQYEGLDRFGRVADQRWYNTNTTSDVDRYTYGHDRDGNVSEKVNILDSGLDETYSYDGLNRLIGNDRASGTTNDQTWALDALGNMGTVTTGGVAQSRSYNSQNQLTGMGTLTLAYDYNGNTTTDDQGHTLVYDAWNRLVQVNSGTLTLKSYAYDGIGRRITESAPSTNPTELYYSSGWQDIEERINASGLTLHTQYVWSPVYVDSMVLRDYDFNATGTLQINERDYALQDANFNVTALVSRFTVNGDATGDGTVNTFDYNVVASHWYQLFSGGDVMGDFTHDGYVDAFDLNVVSANWGSSGSPTWIIAERFVYDAYGRFDTYDASYSAHADYLAWNYNFQDLRLDAVTGLYDQRGRVYSSSMMRELQAEPSGADPYVDGLNLYRMYDDNPINRMDPNGEVAIYFSGYDKLWTAIKKKTIGTGHAKASPGAFRWADKTFAYTDLDAGVKYLEKHKCGPIIIVGYSLGGLTAIQAAAKLKADHIDVDLLATLDPVTDIGTNVIVRDRWWMWGISPLAMAGATVAQWIAGAPAPHYTLDTSNIKEAWNWYENVGENATDFAIGSRIDGARNTLNYVGTYGPGGARVAPHITQHREFQWDMDISNEIQAEARRITSQAYLDLPKPSDVG